MTDKPTASIVSRIATGSGDSGLLANALLRELQQGLPVQELLVLLQDPDDSVVEVGAWVAAELGSVAAPLLDNTIELLRHPSRDVRFYAIDAVLADTVGIDCGRAVAVLPLLDDDDRAVRWKATGFLCRASARQLDSVLTLLTATAPDNANVPLLEWLLSRSALDPDVVRSRLTADDRRTRRYAVAAAVRLLDVTQEPLDVAATVKDPEVQRFAQDWLTIVNAGRGQ